MENVEDKKKKILYVEDNIDNRLLVKRILEAEGYELIEAADGIEGINKAQSERPDLILMDLNLPEMDGIEVTTRIKSIEGLENTLIVALTARAMKGDREMSLIAGCDGYIAKPIDVDALPKQIEEFLQGKRETLKPEEQMTYLKQYSSKLAKRLEEKIRISHIDELTKLANRRGFNSRLEEEYSRIKRFNYYLSCIMIDIDHFKKINDTYGHSIGDKILVELAHVINKHKRRYDLLARYGGEEFVMLLPQTAIEDALIVAERMRRNVESHVFLAGSHNIKITISLGVSSYSSYEPLTKEELVQKADMALYEAKAKGRNRVWPEIHK
jgi:diguanylate cyclase (GGDEF)-like protein